MNWDSNQITDSFLSFETPENQIASFSFATA